MAKERGGRPTEDDYDFTGYQVYDMHYEKIGKVDDVFVGDNDDPEYIGMKVGLLGKDRPDPHKDRAGKRQAATR